MGSFTGAGDIVLAFQPDSPAGASPAGSRWQRVAYPCEIAENQKPHYTVGLSNRASRSARQPSSPALLEARGGG